MGRSKAAKERRQANKADKEDRRSARAQLKREQRRNFVEIESRYRSAVGCGCPAWEACSCGAVAAVAAQQRGGAELERPPAERTGPEVADTRLGGVEPEVADTRLGGVAAAEPRRDPFPQTQDQPYRSRSRERRARSWTSSSSCDSVSNRYRSEAGRHTRE